MSKDSKPTQPAPNSTRAVALEFSKTGVEIIATERQRQKLKGWTLDHDDGHDDGSLAVVAAMVACDGTDAHVVDALNRDDWGIIKKHGYLGKEPDEIHMLAVAGALIAAEIDRLLRMGKSTKEGA